MNKDGMPRGKPQEDSEKVRLWWQEELQRNSLNGEVTLEYFAVDGRPEAWSTGKKIFEAFAMHRTQSVNKHAYVSKITGAPWPLETVVMTNGAGTVTDVYFRAQLSCTLTGEAKFKKSIGWFGEKLELEGPGVEAFRTLKPVLKEIKKALNRRYSPPLWGFHSSKKRLELHQAYLSLSPSTDGCEALALTTVRDEAAFVGRKYSLGLDKIIALFKAVERQSGETVRQAA